MLEDFIISHIRQELPFAPNTGQEVLLRKLGRFLVTKSEHRTFLLKGYAGTGKTSMVAALVRTLNRLNQPFCLLAPTGRAAKVLANYAGFPAYTIHRRIYRQRNLGSEEFALSINTLPNTLFIVDEASMLANGQNEGAVFGSGRLLDDLLLFVFSAPGCGLLLLGDDAQLPPVGQTASPALSADYLRGCGLELTEHTLVEVARQALDSGILALATSIRNQLNIQMSSRSSIGSTDLIGPTHSAVDVESVYDRERFLLKLEESYRDVGPDGTLLITRSNYRTNAYNQGVRNQILWRDESLSTGDRIMVSKNNYFWSEQYEDLPLIANGDMFEIVHLSRERELYDYHFVDATLRPLDSDSEQEIDATLWIDTLFTPTPEENYAMTRELFRRVSEDYPEIRNKRDLIREVLKSPYYNALQVRFAYAVTCHKAQGGQWKRVFVDPEWKAEQQADVDFLRWLYTAVTRAQEQLYLINFPPQK